MSPPPRSGPRSAEVLWLPLPAGAHARLDTAASACLERDLIKIEPGAPAYPAFDKSIGPPAERSA